MFSCLLLGGTMGLFLGWTILYLIEVLIGLFTKCEKTKSKIKFGLLLILWILSGYWCYDIYQAYAFESESMDFHIDKETAITMPEITLCYSHFLEYLKQAYSCIDENQHEFKQAIQNCLENDPSTPILTEIMFKEFEDFGISFFDSIKLVSNLGYQKELDIFLMKKVLHEKYGICYTFQGKYWSRYIEKPF